MISVATAIVICIVGLLAESAALLLLVVRPMRRRASAHLRSALDGAAQNAKQFAEDAEKKMAELFDQSTHDLRAQLETAAAIRDELEHRIRSLDTKAQNNMRVIATLVKERDFWHRWHLDETSAHSAAQHYILSEIELHVKRGCKLPFGTQLAVITKEFDERFPGQDPEPAPGASSGDTPENRV